MNRQRPTIAELEEMLSKDYDVEVLPDGSIIATNERKLQQGELLTFRTNIPDSY